MAGYRRSSGGGEYSVNYALMGGVDFSSPDSISGRRRFSYLENMYRDYDGEGAELTESVPGFRKILSLGEKINGIYFQRVDKEHEFLVIHSGCDVFRMPLKDLDSGDKALARLKILENVKSSAFSFGKNLFLLDGTKIARIDAGGTMEYVKDGGEASPYVPTSYVNGSEYEQLNLLTRLFYEELFVAYPEDIAYESEGLEYRIIDKDGKKCAVTGINNSFQGELFIPTYAKIGNEKYAIEEIDASAFQGSDKISSLTVSEGLRVIGKEAFSGAIGISKINLPDSLKTIGEGAFKNASALLDLRLGRELEAIGEGAFSGCESLSEVKYALDKSRFDALAVGSGIPSSASLIGNHKNEFITVMMPIFTPHESLNELYAGKKRISFYELSESDGSTKIVIPNARKKDLESVLMRVKGYAHKEKYRLNSPGINFMSEMSGAEPSEAITKCSICECFDGRVFLAGNPSFPNTVFYSARDNTGNVNPLYFGVMNYFNDGIGGFPTVSLLAAGDSLAVFKSGDDGTGSIFYHVPKETGIDILPKVYPVSYIHSGIFAVGKSISFFDDPVFISGVGLSALDKKSINLERSIACRSHNVNPELLSKKLENADLAVWCGYLVLLCEGDIFLADSRAPFTHETGNVEYEWYYLTGIGTYTDDDFAYEYIKSNTEECKTHEENLGKKTERPVYSSVSENGNSYFYVTFGNEKYQVGQSSERWGGEFNPATILLGIDNKLLFFGTDNGDVCIFNNDKRGIAPKEISESPGFDIDAYRANMKRALHPEFYSFDKHAPRYALSTVNDDGGIHDMTKDTVKGTFVLRCKSFGGGSLTLEVQTDKRGYTEIARFSDSALNFESVDFSSFAFSLEKRLTIPFAEKEKGWCEKKISIYAEDYASPIGIYAISYRLRPRGKIKKMKF
jgi:hypothetical protein